MNKIDLENKIRHYASLYYAGNPEISDDEFDDLVDQLREIDPNSYVLTTVGWGSGVETNGKKTDHKYQLIGSLNKIKNVDDIPNYRFPVVSAKLDGLSAVLYYKNGKLEKAVTRGNGTQGIDITEKVVRILDGKTTIEPKLTCAIRGELVISVDDWNSMIEVDSSLKNPRNTAAGIINRNDITDDIDYVSLVVYNVIGMVIFDNGSGFEELTENNINDNSEVAEVLKDNIMSENGSFNSFLRLLLNSKKYRREAKKIIDLVNDWDTEKLAEYGYDDSQTHYDWQIRDYKIDADRILEEWKKKASYSEWEEIGIKS